jgi:hypothetical protein
VCGGGVISGQTSPEQRPLQFTAVYSASFFVQCSLRVMGLKIIYLGNVHMTSILNKCGKNRFMKRNKFFMVFPWKFYNKVKAKLYKVSIWGRGENYFINPR